jgi:hypothetical protein
MYVSILVLLSKQRLRSKYLSYESDKPFRWQKTLIAFITIDVNLIYERKTEARTS